ncbi:hypothetical protein IV203_034574 [Nitzschia inconspicua]|uniref:Uncharacterized protein n=1 Tax=Nitzschia inconspicua TaxID=303405 RepID=A0A9K3LEN1_9STRA|nr:hypothetical protein IV203_034574 [Nitzschia inconspicua]
MERSCTGGIVVGSGGNIGKDGDRPDNSLCLSWSYYICLVIPTDDQVIEKQTILRSLGAVVVSVPMASRYYGTGSTDDNHCLCGDISYPKQIQPNIRVVLVLVLVDPLGSSLYHKVEHGVADAPHRNGNEHSASIGTMWLDRDRNRIAQKFDFGIGRNRCSESTYGSGSNTNGIENVDRIASHVITMMCDGGQRHATSILGSNVSSEMGPVVATTTGMHSRMYGEDTMQNRVD